MGLFANAAYGRYERLHRRPVEADVLSLHRTLLQNKSLHQVKKERESFEQLAPKFNALPEHESDRKHLHALLPGRLQNDEHTRRFRELETEDNNGAGSEWVLLARYAFFELPIYSSLLQRAVP